jgi:Fic family protein
LLKPEFNSKTFQINNRTFTKYIQILNKYGLLLLLSEKPLRARIFSNILIEKLLLYFGFKSRIKRIPINYLSEIGGELKQFKRLKRKNEAGFQKIILEREVSFVHHSLALEGNPITLPETIKILREKIIPGNLNSEAVDEVRNYQKALLQMLKDSQHKIPLTIETILEYHHLALQHRPEIAGKMRTVNVYIKGNPNFKIVPVTEIELKLNKLLKQYQMFIRTRKSSLKKVINFASFFHNEFQHIHPFVDGNSRITRLITLLLLQSKDIPILDFPFGLMDEYLHYTKGAKVREDKKLSENIQQIILYNLKKINGQLKL